MFFKHEPHSHCLNRMCHKRSQSGSSKVHPSSESPKPNLLDHIWAERKKTKMIDLQVSHVLQYRKETPTETSAQLPARPAKISNSVLLLSSESPMSQLYMASQIKCLFLGVHVFCTKSNNLLGKIWALCVAPTSSACRLTRACRARALPCAKQDRALRAAAWEQRNLN